MLKLKAASPVSYGVCVSLLKHARFFMCYSFVTFLNEFYAYFLISLKKCKSFSSLCTMIRFYVKIMEVLLFCLRNGVLFAVGIQLIMKIGLPQQ